ncbi:MULTISPECIES: PadR family transcriptional regulator [Gordonibacter]|uniref:PadR family transcriptional regulator n=1 Tax=Gordonibacter faecis TaxID=3047475 RepID=A0ABT7DJH0_9ACTN|nr:MULTISPECIES: PadR family transcriptional regulator [unclassified Gordonibacter]MDJ1649537.1 PadR family transcriptional regulator [Gordonibacter sp. KGMB12511]HIW75054.1 PadR family transcriptional regulator [Candidatus Gordonibacter avicola]
MASTSIEIMILGALIERPMSAYEMDKVLEERNIRRWIRISSPSVYRNVIRLCEEGYTEGTLVKEGEMPEKTVYTITDKGRERFAVLMEETAALPARVDFGFLPVLANISLVDEKTGRALIDELIETHRATAERVDGLIPSYDRLEARATMELCSATYRLVAEHLEHFKKDLYGTP